MYGLQLTGYRSYRNLISLSGKMEQILPVYDLSKETVPFYYDVLQKYKSSPLFLSTIKYAFTE